MKMVSVKTRLKKSEYYELKKEAQRKHLSFSALGRHKVEEISAEEKAKNI